MFCPELLFKASVYERYEMTNNGSNFEIIYTMKRYCIYTHIILFTCRHSGSCQALSEIKL